MRNRFLKVLLLVVLLASVLMPCFTVDATVITVGPTVINRAVANSAAKTFIQLTNPSNGNGTITSVQIWFATDATGVKVGAFYGSGTNYTYRDGATLGNVAGGSKQTFAVSFNISTGDFIGCYYATGTLELDTSGGSGQYWKDSDHCKVEAAQTYALNANYLQSINASGTTPASNVYLTTSSSSGGNVSTPGEAGSPYAYNVSEVVNISATADACYHFVNWTGNTTDIGDVNASSTNISMGTSNKTATANFAINTSTITYTAGANGTLNNSTPQTINCSANTTYVLATGNAHYHFVNWNDSSTMNPRSDVGTSTNQSFLANFSIDTHDLTINSTDGGDVLIPGEGTFTYNYSSPVSLEAQADPCYHFVNWSGDVATLDGVNSSLTVIDMYDNYSITANFAIDTQSVEYIAGPNGSVNGSWPEYIDCGNDSSWVLATPNLCYYFVNWSDASTDNPRQDTSVSSNISVTANFALSVYTVEYIAGAGGTVNGSWPENVNCGSNSSWVKATANACYTFTNWSDASTTNPRQETNVSANVSLTANFTVNTSTITYIAGANGTINGTAVQTINCGSSTTSVNATPNACYHFTSWSDANTSATRTDVGTSTNQTFTASFAINTYTLNVSSGANGNVTTPTEGTHTYNCGQVVNLVATPDWAYNFSVWTGNTTTILDVNDETTTITMNGNYSINCSFVGSLSLFSPTNLIPTLTENASGNTSFWCLNLSWTKGINSPYTIIVICRDEVLPCANKSTTNLSTACMVLYNGNGSSFDIETCGWQIDYYDYTITAWGSDGTGNYSALCTNLALGGTKMTDLVYMAIMAFIGVGLFFVSFWQKKLWIFITAGITWTVFGIFSMNTYAYGTVQFYFGVVCVFFAIILFMAPLWLRARREPAPLEPSRRQLYEERIERELKSVKKKEEE